MQPFPKDYKQLIFNTLYTPPPPQISGDNRTSPSEAKPAGTPFFHSFYSYTIIIQDGEDSAAARHETRPTVIRKDNPTVDDTFDYKNNKPKTPGSVFVASLFFNKRYRNEKNVPDDIGASAFLRRRFLHRISGRFSASAFLLPDARGIVRMDGRHENLHLCGNEDSDTTSGTWRARLLRREQRLNPQVRKMNFLE